MSIVPWEMWWGSLFTTFFFFRWKVNMYLRVFRQKIICFNRHDISYQPYQTRRPKLKSTEENLLLCVSVRNVKRWLWSYVWLFSVITTLLIYMSSCSKEQTIMYRKMASSSFFCVFSLSVFAEGKISHLNAYLLVLQLYVCRFIANFNNIFFNAIPSQKIA